RAAARTAAPAGAARPPAGARLLPARIRRGAALPDRRVELRTAAPRPRRARRARAATGSASSCPRRWDPPARSTRRDRRGWKRRAEPRACGPGRSSCAPATAAAPAVLFSRSRRRRGRLARVAVRVAHLYAAELERLDLRPDRAGGTDDDDG